MEQKIWSRGRKVAGFVTRLVGIRFIRRWGWFLFLSVLLNIVCSYYIPNLVSSTTYRATLQVQVHAVAGTSVQGKATTAFFAGLLQSPGVLDLALTRLHAYPQFRTYVLADLRDGHVTATVIKNTNIIQLAGYADSSGDAVLIVSTIYNALVQNIQKDRAQVIDAINTRLNTELGQVQAAMLQTETTLEQLKAIKQTTSSQYSLFANQYEAQKQRLLEINAELATLKREGYDNLLGVINPTPAITTLPAAHATKNERLALSPLVGMIMGLGGVFVASRFLGRRSEEERKGISALSHRAATIPVLFLDLVLNAGCALLMPIFPLLGLIGAIAINLVVLLFWRTRYALPLYVLVASPSVALSLSAGILSRLYIGNMLFALIVFIWILRVVLPLRKSGQVLLDGSLFIPLLCLMLVGLSSIIYSRLFPDPNVPYQYPHSTVSITLVNISEMMILIGLPMFLAIVPGLIRSSRDAYLLLLSFVGVGMFYALGSIFATPLGLHSKEIILGVQRPEVFGAESSALGSLILLFGSLAMAQTLYASHWRGRLIWGTLSLLFCLGVIMSFGREAWIGLFLALFVMIAMRTRNWSVLLVVLIPFVLLLIPGISDFFNPEKTYGSDRVKIWQDAITIWLKSPYMGVGAGNFQFFDRVYGSDKVGVAHNQYLQMLAEMGIQGLLCLIWILVAVGVKALKSFNAARSSLGKSIALAYIGYYVSILFGGFFTGIFIPSAAAGGGTGPFVAASCRWLLLGLVLSIPIWEQQEKEQPAATKLEKEMGPTSVAPLHP